MPEDKISVRQLLTLLFAALLSPAIQVLPGQSAAIAGAGGWLSALPALPVLLLVCLALFSLRRGFPQGAGLAGAIRGVLGKKLGSVVLAVYLLWGIILLGADARRYALRFLSTSYRNAPLPLFIIILLLAALWVGRGRLCAMARAGEIVGLALGVALGLVLFFGLFQIEADHILPLWAEDIPAIAGASLPVLAVLGYTVFAAFLSGGAQWGEGDEKRCLRWAVGFCGVLTLLQLACLGSFGPALTGQMDAPFFMMVKGIGVQGAFERVESVIIALWILSDLALLCMILFACRAILHELFPERGKHAWAVIPVVGAAMLVALFAFPDSYALSTFMERVVTPGSIIFGLIVPSLLWLIAKGRGMLRQRK